MLGHGLNGRCETTVTIVSLCGKFTLKCNIYYLGELVHHLEDGLGELQLGSLVVGEQPREGGAALTAPVRGRLQLLHHLVQRARVQPI